MAVTSICAESKLDNNGKVVIDGTDEIARLLDTIEVDLNDGYIPKDGSSTGALRNGNQYAPRLDAGVDGVPRGDFTGYANQIEAGAIGMPHGDATRNVNQMDTGADAMYGRKFRRGYGAYNRIFNNINWYPEKTLNKPTKMKQKWCRCEE